MNKIRFLAVASLLIAAGCESSTTPPADLRGPNGWIQQATSATKFDTYERKNFAADAPGGPVSPFCPRNASRVLAPRSPNRRDPFWTSGERTAFALIWLEPTLFRGS